MNQKYANYLLHKTKDDYNLIGHYFSSKRGIITQDLLDLQKYAQNGDRILDLGCGNGRLLEIFKDLQIDYIGADIADTLVKIAKQHYPRQKFLTTDFLSLPFSDGYFDKIYCLSVIHHIPSGEFRRQFLKEIYRVLKPKGKLIITTWYLYPKPGVKWLLIKNSFFKIIGRNPLDFKDIFLPFRDQARINLADRYLHCFTKNEFAALIRKSGLEISQIGYQNRGRKLKHQNIYSIAIKK